MLAISFISAVNRKRKKRREARGLGSSTDDDSEQEAHKPEAGAPAPRAQDRPEGQRPGAAAPEAPGREGVPDLPVAPQDEAGLTKTFQTWPRGWFHIP